MSVPTRRIGYYFMDFTELDTDERTFDKDLFKRLLVYINGVYANLNLGHMAH